MIILKTDKEIEIMRKAGKFAAETLLFIEPYIKPGISTLEINDLCHNFIISRGCIPAPLNYKGFPKSVCTSINNVVCHGIPSDKDILKDGDIINVDVTTIFNSFHGDTSKTFFVGSSHDSDVKKLVQVTKECLDLGIKEVKVDATVGDIGYAIYKHAFANGFSVVIDFVGHGIGRGFHEAPQIVHMGAKGKGQKLVPGMVFTIEPMLNQGTWKCHILDDQWTVITDDNKLSAQFEHTIAIKSDGSVHILTLP